MEILGPHINESRILGINLLRRLDPGEVFIQSHEAVVISVDGLKEAIGAVAAGPDRRCQGAGGGRHAALATAYHPENSRSVTKTST